MHYVTGLFVRPSVRMCVYMCAAGAEAFSDRLAADF